MHNNEQCKFNSMIKESVHCKIAVKAEIEQNCQRDTNTTRIGVVVLASLTDEYSLVSVEIPDTAISISASIFKKIAPKKKPKTLILSTLSINSVSVPACP